jgi:HEAT repeat protein
MQADHLAAADRLAHLQTLADQDDPAVRLLAVTWGAELLPGAGAAGQRSLADLILRLSRDHAPEVQRPAVLALGRVNDSRAFDRLLTLVRRGPAPVRAAAARALAQQARGSDPVHQARQRLAVPALQDALDDPALEVVVEAAEDLGTLGVPEAGPVLVVLLRHPSAPVRQTAAQALERVANPAVLDGLLGALDDPAVTVRFSLVGALGHAAGDGKALSDASKARLLERLEGLLLHDPDPGVRSRAARVLGECGPPAVLPVLWGRVLAAEDGRVQEKAWAAFTDILDRSAHTALVTEWDQRLARAGQGARRVQLLTEVATRWQKREQTRVLVGAVTEALVQAQLEQGKWSAAFPLVRELLARAGGDAELDRRLRLLLAVGEQALQDGNQRECLRAVQEARAFLSRSGSLAGAFDKLERQARQER